MTAAFFQDSVYFGVCVSLLAYAVGVWLRRKTGLNFLNPLLVSIVFVILFLVLFDIDYDIAIHSSHLWKNLLNHHQMFRFQGHVLKRNLRYSILFYLKIPYIDHIIESIDSYRDNQNL